jgi:GGDEF domain-containing protein
VARRLSESVRRHTFRVGAATYEPSVSIGVASHPENGASGPGELAAMADRALYAVKKSGHKGSVVAAADVPRRE